MRWLATFLVAAFSLAGTACFTTRKTFVLPPTPQAVAKPLPLPRIEPPPPIETQLQKIDIPAIELAALPVPETTSPQPTRRAGVRPPSQGTPGPGPTLPTPEIEPQPPPAPSPAAPQLSEIMTEDRRKQYEADFARSVGAAKAALDRAATRRKLTPRQQESVSRIQAFLKQAEESKVKDLATANQLALRAAKFGEDLLRSLQ
jgi:hypothetical protein